MDLLCYEDYSDEQIERIVDDFTNEYNSMHENIKITTKYVCGDRAVIEYLDTNFRINHTSRCIEVATYFKDYNKYLYLNFNSFHHPSVFVGFIITELFRYLTHSTLPEDYEETKKLFCERLLKNEYPSDLIDKVFNFYPYDSDKRAALLNENDKKEKRKAFKKEFLVNFDNEFNTDDRTIEYRSFQDRVTREEIKKQKPIALIIPYNALTMNIDFKKLMVNNKFYIDIVAKNIIVGYTTPPNVGNKVIRSKLINDPIESKTPLTHERILRSMVKDHKFNTMQHKNPFQVIGTT